MDNTAAASSVIAPVAAGWVLDEVPEPLQPVCLGWIDAWRGKAGLSPLNLWLPLAQTLRRYGCLDAEVDLCRLALSLSPDLAPVRLLLTESLIAIGEDAEARLILSEIARPPAARLEALGLLARLPEQDGHLDELEALLLESGEWSGHHAGLARRLMAAGQTERAAAFLAAWMRRWPVAPAAAADIAGLALLCGDAATARRLFTSVWPRPGNEMVKVFGNFPGSVPPYDDAVESGLLRRIDHAFRLDEDRLARLPPGDFGPVPADATVMLVSFPHGALPNDMAEHLAGTAAAAGVTLDLHLDAALATPDECRRPDGFVRGRIEAFAAHLAAARPAVVIVDCCGPLGFRGLNPAVMADLKERFGFHLVCLMRDAHSYALPGLRAWLPACDSMLLFDPASPLLDPRLAPANAKAIVLPVPALHGPFLERPPRGGHLLFIGAANFAVRQAVLSVLLTEDIPVTAIIGKHLAAERPDTAAYARRLAGAGAVVNVSAHTPSEHLVTGRVWETIAAGALLIEQDNDAVARFFTPWRHYLPWTDVADIVQIVRLMGRRPEAARRVAEDGHAWAARHYHAQAFWTALIGHALRPDRDRDAAGDLRAARAWHEVFIG
ncbi:glycosyltransferase [Magnetospirillum sp. SS-4]|uniref:glycosyltransferase n=1 Tax=Magnetospirillum sp. SS-4 TaxID=2681465 RepID=UPI001385BDF2|nr:glycosyltransferase [Magnetospirillum sp. SS-4]CAA7627497.1 hypothetical protein MTBSS4_90034 [Magnetospirillum sp. SS-4]